MSCAGCGTENPAGARFCMACGEALERRCPNCGTARAGRGPLLHELRRSAGRHGRSASCGLPTT